MYECQANREIIVIVGGSMSKKEYKPLTIPRLTWNKKTLSEKYGELVAQPLEPGFGDTLGNALRRVLLAAVEGSAVTSVVIKGITNEFAAIPGVVEDGMQVILNTKGIVIRNHTGLAGKMHLKVKGESVARVSDIVADAHLELVNPEHVIAHVAAGGELDMQFFVESGRAYQLAQWPSDKNYQEDGRIYIDAMFSPIRNVMYDLEKTRVGQDINYDKMTLKINTNGSANPTDVVHYAVSVLRTQLEHFLVSAEIPFNDISVVPVEAREDESMPLEQLGLEGVSVDLLLKPIEELELSVRAHNCLINAGIKRVIDLVNSSEDDILKIKNFGRKSLNEVKDSMKGFGLLFSMNINEDEIKRHVRN